MEKFGQFKEEIPLLNQRMLWDIFYIKWGLLNEHGQIGSRKNELVRRVQAITGLGIQKGYFQSDYSTQDGKLLLIEHIWNVDRAINIVACAETEFAKLLRVPFNPGVTVLSEGHPDYARFISGTNPFLMNVAICRWGDV